MLNICVNSINKFIHKILHWQTIWIHIIINFVIHDSVPTIVADCNCDALHLEFLIPDT